MLLRLSEQPCARSENLLILELAVAALEELKIDFLQNVKFLLLVYNMLQDLLKGYVDELIFCKHDSHRHGASFHVLVFLVLLDFLRTGELSAMTCET